MQIIPRSLLPRFVALYLLLTLLNVSIFTTLVWIHQSDLIVENSLLENENRLRSYQEDIPALLSQPSSDKLQRYCDNHEITLHVYDSTGSCLYGEELTGEEKVKILYQIKRLITRKSYEKRASYSAISLNSRTITHWAAIPKSANIMRINHSLQELDTAIAGLYKLCLIVIAVVALIHTFFALVVYFILVPPFKTVLKAIRNMSSGHLGEQITLERDDEIGELINAYNTMSRIILEMHQNDSDSNPLTHMPGNNIIMNMIERRLHDNVDVVVLYCDLDNFKAFNDAYGVVLGDKVILYTADLLRSCGSEYSRKEIFLGHEGGDDFVAIATAGCWKKFSESVTSKFDEGAPDFYNETDKAQGFINSVDREGNPKQYPLVSISIAAVCIAAGEKTNHEKIMIDAARLKKKAKEKQGSSIFASFEE